MAIEFKAKPGLVVYLTAGDPDLATTSDIALAAIDNGADVIELGVPFSDPLADGPVIQRASERAVAKGTRLTDVLALQSDVARAIAGEIRARVTTEEAGRLSRNRKVVPAAWDAYLLGRYYWDQFTEESILKAIDYYEQAIQLDPGYAAAYAGIAECWGGLIFSDARPWNEAIPRAREAATKALALDDSLAEAHNARAGVLSTAWRWSEAEQEYRRALELNPNNGTVHYFYAVSFLIPQKRFDEAESHMRIALALDPLSPIMNTNYAMLLMEMHRYTESKAQFEKTIARDPNFPPANYKYSALLAAQGDFAQACKYIRKWVVPSPPPLPRRSVPAVATTPERWSCTRW